MHHRFGEEVQGLATEVDHVIRPDDADLQAVVVFEHAGGPCLGRDDLGVGHGLHDRAQAAVMVRLDVVHDDVVDTSPGP